MKNTQVNILFTSCGRRVSLIRKFKKVMADNSITGKVLTTDIKSNAPAAFFSDKHYLVPRVANEKYVGRILEICKQESINLVIPLIDTELMVFASNKSLFEKEGVQILVSSSKVIEIASDKIKTNLFFIKNNIDTPKVYSMQELSTHKYKFPLLIKPRDGSSSEGVFKVNNENELDFFGEYIPNAMVQEYINGTEYTVDVMTDFQGNIKSIVPRQRIETRAGEVSKGITKKDQSIIDAVERVINLLPGPKGCITIQCFKQENNAIKFIEINPRYGGGIPLSIEAGANFPLWTIQSGQGQVFNEKDFSWKENLTMLRFDEEVFSERIQDDNSISI
ncbi:ATP-grasp domain-containing protein [Pseudalkalibacillus caeni]|uniref:ATP-grasp domain-containing protein n=1 Tax=Exobacillus caeni TaxID=2574798 RepID=A0A5R9F2N2_9BACL|nr:ATP-grasp domain-containing protein [Pseudalkalibacillus caeni]TLS35778.1 ATP-grasp domain-containing protein [Pseudalkalibacillus caeni]